MISPRRPARSLPRSLPRHLAPVAVLLGLSPLAFSAFTASETPAFRGSPLSEFGAWESFAEAFAGPNLPDDPLSTTLDAALTQHAPGAFVTGSGNIYNPAGTSEFTLSDTTPGDLQILVLQISTEGTELAYGNVRLEYVDSNGITQALPPHTTTELARFQTTGDHVETRFDFDLTGIGDFVQAYELKFESAGAHMSLDAVIVDTLSSELAIVYCTSQTNSQGCLPSIHHQGVPSVSSGSPFVIGADSILNNRPGVLFYGFAANNLPFQGGFLCVKPPTKRTQVQSSAGNPPPTDCSGTFAFDFNAHAAAGVDPNLTGGTQVFAQYWSRDPQSASTTNLSNAVEFTLAP